jgi:hypothetical protein
MLSCVLAFSSVSFVAAVSPGLSQEDTNLFKRSRT